MFIKFKKEYMELQDYKNKYEELLKQIEVQKALSSEEVYGASVEIDFEGMNAVSIERISSDDTVYGTRTIIGYMTPNNSQLAEWYIYCNMDTHNYLVEKFRQYLKTKYQ